VSLPARSWFAALSLGERCAGALPRAQGADHLAAWRAQKPFATHADLWAARVREAGLDEDELAGLTAEPSDELSGRVTPPAWLVRLDAALRDERPLDSALLVAIAREKSNHRRGCLRLVAPFIRGGLPTLREALAEAERRGVPMDAERVLVSLLPHVPALVDAPLTRTIALEVHVARTRGLLAGDSPEERFDFFIDAVSDPDVLPAFWERHPVLARHASVLVASYVEACAAALGHLAEDWAEVLPALVAPSDGKLVAVVANDSETHRAGKIVMTLHFESGSRVVYKPRSADVDQGYAQALAWLAARAPGLPVPRSVRVVSRHDHSFHEHIEARSCASEAELGRFFERQGIHLALLYVLLARDMHAENLIASGDQPVLIDLEALLQPTAAPAKRNDDPAKKAVDASVLASLFLPGKLEARDDAPGVDISALGARSGQRSPMKSVIMVQLGTDEVRATFDREPIGTLGQRPGLEGKDADATAWVDEVVSGFTRAWQVLEDHKDDFVQGPLAALRNAPVRVIQRPTDYYVAIATKSYHPSNLEDGLARERVIDALYLATRDEPHLLAIIASERADLLQGDVPFFWMRPGSRDLVDSRGLVFRDYFEEAPFVEAVRRARGLCAEWLRRQVWLIRASFATITMGHGEQTWAPSNTTLEPLSVSRDALVERACRLGDRLIDLALQDGGRAGWLTLDLVRERDWVVAPAGSDLYGGASGIALFLAHLGAVTLEGRFTELARDSVATIFAGLTAQLESSRPVAVGIGGASGAIFALAHMGALWKDAALLDRAEDLARAVSRHVAADGQFDVLEGAAGCLLAMLALHRARPGGAALGVARACGERLRAGARTGEEGTAWPSRSFESPLGGFGHGASGIAVALLRLAALDETEADLRSLARGAFAFERTLFDVASGNWRDLRPVAGGRFMTAWCHGAPGVGLARIEALPAEPALLEEAACAARTTARSGFGLNHSLCHGDFGNLELLHRARALPGGPGADAFRERLGGVCASLDTEGPLCGVPRGIETPGLFAGLSGIGWQLLRFAEPSRIPSLLTFDPPA